MPEPDLEEVKKIVRSVLIGEKEGILHRNFLGIYNFSFYIQFFLLYKFKIYLK